MKKDDIEQKIIDIRRVARVVAGGRRFSFRVALVVGNRNGEVGFGVEKAADTALAIEKAGRSARKHIIRLALTKERSLPFEIFYKYGPAKILLKPAPEGSGLIAGGAVRSVLELGGVQNASAKILSRSKNKLNSARATIEALRLFGRFDHRRQATEDEKKIAELPLEHPMLKKPGTVKKNATVKNKRPART